MPKRTLRDASEKSARRSPSRRHVSAATGASTKSARRAKLCTPRPSTRASGSQIIYKCFRCGETGVGRGTRELISMAREDCTREVLEAYVAATTESQTARTSTDAGIVMCIACAVDVMKDVDDDDDNNNNNNDNSGGSSSDNGIGEREEEEFEAGSDDSANESGSERVENFVGWSLPSPAIGFDDDNSPVTGNMCSVQ